MSEPVPGRTVPSPSEVAQRSWWSFRHYNPASAEDPRLCYLSGYARATRDMTADLFRLGGWDVVTRRLLEVMEELLIEREGMRMADEVVPYDPE